MAPCPLRVLTKPPHKTLGFPQEERTSAAPPPLPTNTGYNINQAHTHTEHGKAFLFSLVFLKGGGEQIQQEKSKHYGKWISMPFLHLV